MKALRTCTKCGKIAETEEQLDLFMPGKGYKYGRKNKCRVCENKEREESRREWKKTYRKTREAGWRIERMHGKKEQEPVE